MIRKISFATVSLLVAASSWGVGMGQTMFPLEPQSKIIGAEVTGVTSSGGGMGVQGRYTQKLNPSMVFDAGLGIAGGERDSRIFAGLDTEIFPDYGNQPRVSAKISLANAKEFDTRRNILSIAPMVSKGFSFWGTEAFPFISLPYGINLNDDNGTYQSQLNVSFGAAGNIPFDGYRKYIATIEGTIDIKDSYTGVFLGFGYPL